MRYSLVSQFQGALLGGALGEILGANCQVRLEAELALPWSTVAQWGFASPQAIALPQGWGQVILHQMQQLSQTGKWAAIPVDGNSQLAREVQPLALPERSPAGLTVATLPLAIYWHDNLTQLQRALQQRLGAARSPAGVSALIMAYGLALALREQLEPHHLIPHLLLELELEADYPDLAEQLMQVQRLVQQSAPLAIAQSLKVNQPLPAFTPLAIALYCFLSTPDDFHLSVIRAAQLQHTPQVTCLLTAALSGAYNSKLGIPPHWRWALSSFSQPSSSQPPLSQLWGLATLAELEQQIDQFFAAWSGVYQPAQGFGGPVGQIAIAAPERIRPRPLP